MNVALTSFLYQGSPFLVRCYCDYFLFRVLHIRKVVWCKGVTNLFWRKKKVSVHGANGKILNLIQHSTIFPLCITSLHLPFAFPPYHVAPRGFLSWFSFSTRNRQGMEESRLLGESGRTRGSFQKGTAPGLTRQRFRTQGVSPVPGGISILQEVGTCLCHSLQTPSTCRLHLLPRGFKKHHLKLEGVWIQAVVYGMAKGVANRELMTFTSDPNPVTMLWPRCLFSLACLNINTQRVRECVRSVVSGTLWWALQGWKEFRGPDLLPEAERQPVWMVWNWAVFQTPRRGCISGRLL